MTPIRFFAFVIASLAAPAFVQAADRPLLPGELPPQVAAPDFQKPLEPVWTVTKGTWTPAGGILQGVEIPTEKHVAVLHLNLGLDVAVIECEFRAPGPFTFYAGCDSASGHVGRVVVNAANMVIAEDSVKPSHVLATLEQKTKPGEWHHLRVEWRGDQMAARLDGKELSASHPYLATPKKRSWLAVGRTVEVRALTIHGTAGKP